MTTAIEFKNVSRQFGDVRAVDEVSFTVREGEFFSMLGPSGSGKTTCLRLVAGFELPDAGQLFIRGQDVSKIPPYQRQVNTVFQDYALFPHMSILENVGYGLMVRKVPRAAWKKRALEMLATVKLEHTATRKPGQLSGGQRQRIALARALINEPRVLLLDEPLGALDLKLREAMQIELKALQRRLGITFIYVTHDQQEALGMSDRVAVFNNGKVEQIDTPQALYEKPQTAFVANFVGTSNVLTGELAKTISQGKHALISVRPERIRFGHGGADDITLQARLVDKQFHGATSRFEFDVDGLELCVVLANSVGTDALPPPGTEPVPIHFPRSAVHFLGSPA